MSSVLYIILGILLSAICIALNVMILMQNKKSAGLSGVISGMGGQSQTYWDKNKSRSKEGRLEKWSKISGVAYMLLCLLLNFLK